METTRRLAIFRINFKSDFVLTLQSDAGWNIPFCIKFWTSIPTRAYYAGWDGTTYTHCAPVAGDSSKLQVQFDNHNLPIGELKYQIGYHFTVDDFPTTVEDEVINQGDVIIDNNGRNEKVLLDFNGETAPDIQFSLPAYASEAQRIANEEQRIENEQQRISNEETRILHEWERQRNEQTRIAQEEARERAFTQMQRDSESATSAANDAATLANSKARLAQEKAEYAQQQGDFAKEQGETAQLDHTKAAGDHQTALADHQTAAADHQTAVADHQIAAADHQTAESDHTRAGQDHTDVQNAIAAADLVYDISKAHASGGVLATYADLSAALGTNGANVPVERRQGGMTVQFVRSSDNKYVQYRLMHNLANTSTAAADFANTANWQGVDEEPIIKSKNLVESGGVSSRLNNLSYLLNNKTKYSYNINPNASYVTDVNIEIGDRLEISVDAESAFSIAVVIGTSMAYSYITQSNSKVVFVAQTSGVLSIYTTSQTAQQSANINIRKINHYYEYAGIATPSMAPAEPDKRVLYIANANGVYTNFGGITINNETAILLFNENGWSKEVLYDIDVAGNITDINAWITGEKYIKAQYEGSDRAVAEFESSNIVKVGVKNGYAYVLLGKVNESDSWSYIISSWVTNDTSLEQFNYNYYEIKAKNTSNTNIPASELNSIVILYVEDNFDNDVKSIINSEVGGKLAVVDSLSNWKNVYNLLSDYTFTSGKTRVEFLLDFRPYTIKIKDGYYFTLQGRNLTTDSWTYVQGSWTSGTGEYLVPNPTYAHYKIIVRNVADTSLANDDLSDVIRIRYINSVLTDVQNIMSHPIYVDYLNGNDNNLGEITSPLKSIQIAINTGRPVVLRDGIHEVSSINLNLIDNLRISAYSDERPILFAGKKIATADGELVSGYTKVYSLNVGTSFNYNSLHWIHQFGVNDTSTEILAEDRTAYHGRRVYRCDCTTLTKVSSIAAIESADSYSFYYESGTLYYSRPSALSVSNFLFYTSTNNLFSSTAKKYLDMSGVEVYGTCVNIDGALSAKLNHCKVFASKSGEGFKVNNSTNVVLRNCEAARVESGASSNTGDGFNMHTSGTLQANGHYTAFTLENCWSHDNWNDGYSDHEGCEGFINGGLFEYNCIGGEGGGLTPAYGAHDVIVNAICQKNKAAGLRYTSTGGTHTLASITANGVVSRRNNIGFFANQLVDYVTFTNCIAYENATYGFRNGGAASFVCINCKAIGNTTDNFSGDIVQI